MQLIVPMAGKSSRFPNLKPKWMLTHPNGKFMVIEAISGINLTDFEKIHFVYLKEHEEQHHFMKGFMEEVEDLGIAEKVNMVGLDEPTKDQPETVREAIIRAKIEGPILIKDSDNFFAVDAIPDNSVCISNLNDCDLIKARNKSYVLLNNDNLVVNIVEKQVISADFCVGGYGFKDAGEFVKALDTMPISSERYISNIIFHMMLNGNNFTGLKVTDYSDWGTVEDWDRFKRGFGTLFVDLDGTLVMNSSAHFPPYIGESDPLQGNVDILKHLQSSGKFEIIITTARPEKYRPETVAQLERLGIKYHSLLMGLQHGKRIIINDYSKTNPYKSCDAINLKRNSNELKDILKESLGVEYEEI